MTEIILNKGIIIVRNRVTRSERIIVFLQVHITLATKIDI